MQAQFTSLQVAAAAAVGRRQVELWMGGPTVVAQLRTAPATALPLASTVYGKTSAVAAACCAAYLTHLRSEALVL